MNKIIQLGFIEKGTGKHQSNAIYDTGGAANTVCGTIQITANDRYRLCDRTSYCIDANYAKGTTLEHYIEKHRRQLVIEVVSNE